MKKINKTKLLTVRMTENELIKVHEIAQNHNMTISEYVRKRIFK